VKRIFTEILTDNTVLNYEHFNRIILRTILSWMLWLERVKVIL